jgi:hypothetical protein
MHCDDCDGSFRTHIEFMHINNIPPSWKRTYMHTPHIPQKNYKDL